jgi:hypothetical protein
MKGTAIEDLQYSESVSSRFADYSLATTARADSWATIMLGGSLLIPWKTISEAEQINAHPTEFETKIEISEAAFTYFVEKMLAPPGPNAELSRLLHSESE